jgi:replication factor C large subunit
MGNESLVDKYKPQNFDNISGHPSAIKSIRKWGEDWSQGDRPLLLHGPAGTGKTSTAEVTANEMDWEYIEVNASSNRRTEDIERLAQQMRSKGERLTLYTLDEVDSIDGRSLQVLYSVLEDSPNPVICTANELWKVPDGLENRCKKHKFNLRNDSIKSHLRDIVEQEDISISSRQLGQLATRNGIRDALNDLQEYVESDGQTDWDERDTDDSPFAVTRRLLLNKDYLGDMTPDDMVAFLNENTKNEFDGVEAMRAYQALGEADKWLGHVNRNQDYSWWRYAGSISEEVSNLRLTEPYNDWVNVNYPSERRNYTPKATSDNKEAQFYRELKNEQGYSGSFDFGEFREVILPLLKSLNSEQKKRLALSHSLSENSMEVIDLDPSDFEDWEMQESVDDSSNSNLSDFIDDDETEEDEKGLFDY